jgi:hypothetical protein
MWTVAAFVGPIVTGLGNPREERLQWNGGGSRRRTSQKRTTIHRNLLAWRRASSARVHAPGV